MQSEHPRLSVVALCGSLRKGSSNAALLRAAAAQAPAGMEVSLYEGLGDLPLFNPDLDVEGMAPPPPVGAFRAALGAAQGFLISTPEYAHGLPGALKNALDWIVSSGELMDKPICVLPASPYGGAHAQAALCETLTVMSARVLEIPKLPLGGVGPREPAFSGPELQASLKRTLEGLRDAIHTAPTG